MARRPTSTSTSKASANKADHARIKHWLIAILVVLALMTVVPLLSYLL